MTERLSYRVNEFAQANRLSLWFVKQEIYRGNLRAVKKGRIVLIPADAAREYLSEKKENAEQGLSLATAA